ncbi:MAG: InlB B-repeat-containing protein [Candidatus Saccharibacteria bacterium]|nr:InlB B-repeat-containing protein [Candidatus Saccharibacteria bacterium]
MRRKTKSFGRLKLVAVFLFISVLLPKFINSWAATDLGVFADGETGLKLCAIINDGFEDALRFSVTSDHGFTSDVVVPNNSCKTIQTEAAQYTIHQFVPQEYELTSVAGGTVSADNTSFVATEDGQYSVIYTNNFTSKPYFHSFGYTGSSTSATAAEVVFDANGGHGKMEAQHYGLNAEQNLSKNIFAYDGYEFIGWNTKADGSGDSYEDGQALTFEKGGELKLYAQWEERKKTIADLVKDQYQESEYQIDFSRIAQVSDDPVVANGNGINKYTEDGTDVYYYRGEVSNNYAVWGGLCWRIIRTTSTGGIKLLYAGERTWGETEDGDFELINECIADDDQVYAFDDDIVLTKYNDKLGFANVGYMAGVQFEAKTMLVENGAFYIYKNYTRDGASYVLDGENDGTKYPDNESVFRNSTGDYKYICVENERYDYDSDKVYCDKIGLFEQSSQGVITYLDMGDYESEESIIAAMLSNQTDSNQKKIIEKWFEKADLAQYEDELEDAIFCNDRSFKAEDLIGGNTVMAAGIRLDSRNGGVNPSLDCINKNDSFTKDDTVNGNGLLKHKVGIMTADEIALTGNGHGYVHFDYFSPLLSMTPASASVYFGSQVYEADTRSVSTTPSKSDRDYFLRPVVSVKSDMEVETGNGLPKSPFVIK